MAMGNRGAACAVLLGALLVPATRAVGELQLVVDGGSGRRGETVEVAIRLANDPDGSAVTADLDIDFPIDLVEFVPPVRTTCAIAPRLAATHQVGGMLIGPGQLGLAIFDPTEPTPLGDGDLATCEFHILPDAASSPATLAIAFASLNDNTAHELPLDAPDGAIRITDAPGNCVADCDGDGVVAVNEVIQGVNIALGNQPASECPAADADGDGMVTISELITAVQKVTSGC